jgi:hypothetical protein
MAMSEYMERRQGVAQIRIGALGLAITAGLAWWPHAAGAEAAVATRTNVVVGGAAPEQFAMAQWAVGRFEGAGLNPPSVDIEFHDEGTPCDVGHLSAAHYRWVGAAPVANTRDPSGFSPTRPPSRRPREANAHRGRWNRCSARS